MNRRYASDRLFCEHSELQRERSGQFAFEVHRASAHARDDSSVLNLFALELHQNDRFPGSHKIVQHPDHHEIKPLDLVAGKNRVGIALHAGANVANRYRFRGFG